MAGDESDTPGSIPVKAVLRGRPLIPKEINEGCQACLEFIPNANQVVLSDSKSFTFDHVFGADIGQEEVYNKAVKPLTTGIFRGYHATVLAYGQTGSGKTYSMGSAYSSANVDDETTGIIPRVIADIFDGISERSDRKFTVKVSYLELYKKDLNDLLCTPADRQPIMIRDAPDGGTIVTGLTEIVVSNLDETLQVMERGNAHRTTAATAMNLVSSRSHAIFTIMLESISNDDRHDKISSKFHLVDLAGSERAKRTKAEGERLQEGIKINEGLLALGNVISALADENLRSGHIKYRDSKLTRILQGSLGGNSHTLMIACVSPADSNHEETLNTLRYADRVRKIKNKPIVNRDPQAALIATLRKEIQELNLKLLERGGDFQPSSSFRPPTGTDHKIIEKMNQLETENTKLSEQLQQAVESQADMCEKVILAELTRDKLKEQLSEIEASAKTILKEFPVLSDTTQDLDNVDIKNCLPKLISFHKATLGIKIADTSNIFESSLGAEDGQTSPHATFDCNKSTENIPRDEHIAAAHAMKNADLGKQLQELTKTLALKEALAKKMSSNDTQIAALRDQYETKLQQLDKDIQSLTKEKTGLEQALQHAQKTNESRKLSEKRRQRVVELETQIQELRKERKEKEKLVRLKTESDRSIERLNREIQDMKRNRVNLMKQIKSENEKFKAWKKEKAKEVKQLQEKNRKRNFEYVKLERTYDKQKAILRRKTEEAAAANKRLKDAMNKQQAAAAKRRANERRNLEGAGPKIRAWLDEEVEFAASIREAEHHLSVLLEDRKILAQEIQNNTDSPNKRRRTFTQDEFSSGDRVTELRQEMKLKNAQIQEIQNKLSEAKERHSGNSRWTNVSTMVDARFALKHSLHLIVEEKMEVLKLRDKIREVEKQQEEAETALKALQIQTQKTTQKHQEEKTILEQTHQEEISVYISRLGDSSLDHTRDELEKLKSAMSEQHELIENLKAERSELHKQLIEKKTATPVFSAPFMPEQSFFKPIRNEDSFDVYTPGDEDSYDEEDEELDPEYAPTPKRRSKKRISGVGCSCRRAMKPCNTSSCGCVKKGTICGDYCKCTESLCCNRVLRKPAKNDENVTVIKNALNETFDVPVVGEAEPVRPSTSYFPTFDKENMECDVIPRTPIEGKKSDQYKPVYFHSPLSNKN